MQDIFKQMSSLPIYLICGAVIAFVAVFSLVLLVRAWKAGIAVGMDKTKLKRAVTASMTFTILPAVSILLGVIALSGTLGIPLPWLRLSVIGALHYEASVADIAAKSVGLSGLRAEEMTLQAFTTIALVMTVGIIWGLVSMLIFGKKYCSKLQGGKKSGGRSFGDEAMNAMFVGLISAYTGSYIGQLVQLQNGGCGAGHGRIHLDCRKEAEGVGGEFLHRRQHAGGYDRRRRLRPGILRKEGVYHDRAEKTGIL